jgi:protease PrsW
LFSFAFLPPILYAIWIRNTEKYNREKWKPIIVCFLWGATIAIVASIILELILGISLAISFDDGNILGLVTAIIIAPFAEELTKPLALRTKTVKKELDELEDGLIYGAVAGLGFSATENLLYGWCFLSEGLFVFLVLIIIRSFGGCLLHASATALTGYGYGKTIILGKSILRVLPFFVLAIFVHAFYNFLVSLDIVGLVVSLFAALIFVAISIRLVRNKIKSLDMLNR